MPRGNPIDCRVCLHNGNCHYATTNPHKKLCPVCGRKLVTIYKRVFYGKV